MKKIFNLIFTILFLFSAYLQFNDPDAWLWILIYGYLATYCLFSFFKPLPKGISYISIIFLLAYAVALTPGAFSWFIEKEQHIIIDGIDLNEKYREETRELFGLLIGVMVIVLDMGIFKNWKRPVKKTS